MGTSALYFSACGLQRLAQLQAQRMDNAIALTYALGGGYAADASHAPAAGIGHDSGTDQHGTAAR